MAPRPVVSPRPGSVPPPIPVCATRRRRATRVEEPAADSTIPLDLTDLMLEAAEAAVAEAEAAEAATAAAAEAAAADRAL